MTPHPKIVGFALTLGLVAFLFPLTAQAQIAGLPDNCDPENPAPCTTSTYMSPTDGSGHVCSWSGLTIQCEDTQYKVCTSNDGTNPVTCTDQYTTRVSHGIFQVADFVAQFVRLSQWGLGFVVILGVLMFIWGGWQFLTAAGRSSMIEEGKKIIGGTIIGLIISVSAYVLINFTVMSLTGTGMTTMWKFAGPIGLVFPGQKVTINGKEVNINRPFAGETTTEESRTGCRSSNNDTWTKGCWDHVYCSDPGTGTNGEVARIQKQLKAKKCTRVLGNASFAIDGCFGVQTTDSVREFQLANSLAPTGVVDAETSRLLLCDTAGCSQECGATAMSLMDYLPKAKLPDPALSNDTSGCCVVSSADNPLYCIENSTPQNCGALNSSGKNEFLPNQQCRGSNTNGRCGYCQTTKNVALGVGDSAACFQFASPYWCGSIASDFSDSAELQWRTGTCDGVCSAGCRHTLQLHPQ